MLRLFWLMVLLASHAEAKLDHIELITAGADAQARLPMIIAIHGLGDRPEAFAGLLKALPLAARVIVPRGKRAWGRGHTWFTIERPPGPKMLADMADSTAQLMALIEELTKSRPTVGKPVVLGFSQGGMLSFALAAAHPEAFSAVMPLAGALPPALWPNPDSPPDVRFGRHLAALAGVGARPIGARRSSTTTAPNRARRLGQSHDLPTSVITSGGESGLKRSQKAVRLLVLALHGAADERIAAKYAQRTVAGFVAKGYDARLRTWPGVGHHISAPMRRALFEALARHLPQ